MNLPPKDWSFQNNLVVCADSQFIRVSGETGFRWIGNIFWNPEGPCAAGRNLPESSVRIIDPELVRSEDGLWRLSEESPAIDGYSLNRNQLINDPPELRSFPPFRGDVSS